MLLYDLMACQPYLDTQNHGGKEYAEAVFTKMMEMNITLAGIYDSKRYINEQFLDYCKNHGGVLDVNEISVQKAVDLPEYDVFYSALPYFYSELDCRNIRFVGNIHGLRGLEAFTDKYEYQYTTTIKSKIIVLLKKLPITKSLLLNREKRVIDKIISEPSFVCITGSEHSKHSIILNFPYMKSRDIRVFYDPLIIEDPKELTKATGDDYYLLVSGNRFVKNTYRGIIALDGLISKGLINKKVVVTGVVKGLNYLSKIKNKDHFILKGYVSTEELSSLYKNAYSLIFLSLSEGFGYPPLEAISRGVPVVCSPLTAIYEVYQNGVLYCNPFSIDDIQTKILMMEDRAIRDEYIEKGKNRALEIEKLQDYDLEKLVNYIVSFAH